MTIAIAVLNESTVLKDDDILPVVEALNIQLSRDFAPIWDVSAAASFYAKGSQIPENAWQLIVLDDSDQADALGYHDLTPSGQPLGKVFANSDLQAGTSWSVTMSHELLEMLIDPFCNLCAQDGDVMYAYEVCDPVEDDSLGYEINDVLLSDFVTPAWFSSQAAGPYSFCESVVTALTLAKGGYDSFMQFSGGWQQETNESKQGELVPRGSRRERRRKEASAWEKSSPR